MKQMLLSLQPTLSFGTTSTGKSFILPGTSWAFETSWCGTSLGVALLWESADFRDIEARLHYLSIHCMCANTIYGTLDQRIWDVDWRTG